MAANTVFGFYDGAPYVTKIFGKQIAARAKVNVGVIPTKAGSAGAATWLNTGDVLPKALTRFRMPWQWSGGPAVLQSRATDETGMVQPTRAQFIAERGLRGIYHFNAIASWGVSPKGEVSHVYA